MDDLLTLDTLTAAAGAVLLVFVGGWENSRRAKNLEARKEAAADRAALRAQGDELVAAVLALRVAGNAHDQVWGGWRARLGVALRAMLNGGAAYAVSGKGGASALLAAYGQANQVIDGWDRDSAVSAAALAAPLSRLGTAVAPLLGRPEPGVAEAAEGVFTAAVKHYGDETRMAAALSALQEALQAALELPAPRLRRWARRGPQRGGQRRVVRTRTRA